MWETAHAALLTEAALWTLAEARSAAKEGSTWHPTHLDAPSTLCATLLQALIHRALAKEDRGPSFCLQTERLSPLQRVVGWISARSRVMQSLGSALSGFILDFCLFGSCSGYRAGVWQPSRLPSLTEEHGQGCT